MKSKFVLLAIAAIISISAVEVANAQNQVTGVTAKAGVEVSAETNMNRNNVIAQASASTTIRGNATSSAAKNNPASTTRGNATSTAAKDKQASSTNGEITSASHRSIVAIFVQSLLAVADREGGIGGQVRTVAQSQNDSGSTTATAISKVEERGSFHTFLTGNDYRNLGVIRSEIATTSANIAKLRTLLSQATGADREELNVQIKALEDEQVKLELYIKTNEDKFSLLGWFNRLFIK